MINYVEEFPISVDLLPQKLRSLLEPVGDGAQLRVEVATQYNLDQYGPNREILHLLMASVPESDLSGLVVLSEASNGVVCYSTPSVDQRGGLANFCPSVSGYDYIVASWGDGHFYSYSLADKVWMALGLSPRCIGGVNQRVIYDDLSLPEFGVAEGEISTEYYFSPKRNVCWEMSNEYLRRYLWMRGAYGVRVFFYEKLLPDCPDLRALMGDDNHVQFKPDGGWYELDIREHCGQLLIQVWATIAAVTPNLCPDQSADGLVWPGVAGEMTHARANALVDVMPVYLDDRFLERYEQSSLFDTTPVKVYCVWSCSPSYGGQWCFTDCIRIGRNLIKVSMRELYKPKPDREIVHAHAYALDPTHVAGINQDEEHIVSKTERFLDQMLDAGDQLATLSTTLGAPKTSTEVVVFSRAELAANGWLNYPELTQLAQVAPLTMTEQAFLSRCKSIYEVWQRIPNGLLRNIVSLGGHARSDIKNLGSLRLLQALINIVERLNNDGEGIDAFSADADPVDLTSRNDSLAPLFINNDLRIADAHDAGDVLQSLEVLGFDIAALNDGYGKALDHVFDEVISAFAHLNKELSELLKRSMV